MFSHRLKIELRENRIYILIWALVLLTLTIAAILLWRSAPVLDPVTSRLGSPSPDLIALLLLPLVALLIVTTITSFRQDNLKDPQTFWNTRPVRPRTLHRTKFIFLHLLFTLPLTLCTFIVSINATTMSTSLIYAAESALWSAAAIHLCALCCLHNHQWARLPILPALGFLGFILVALIVSKLNIAQPGRYNPGRFSVNTLFITLILLFLFALAGFHLIKKPGTTYPLWMPFLIGALTFPLLTATWLPDNFSKSTEAQQYQPSEPLTTFSNSNSSINRQYFYDLNYPLIDLMGNQDRIPINLLSQRIDSAPLSQFPSGIRAELKYWSSGMDPLDGPQNLQTIALDQENRNRFRVTLSLSIPHEHSLQTSPQFNDLPRKQITLEGEVEILTASLDDALTIDQSKEFTHETSGGMLTYHPSDGKGQPDTIQSKVFRLPLVSANLIHPHLFYRNNDILVAMRHRVTGQSFILQNGSSSTRYGPFGKVQYSEIQHPEESSLVSHYWKNYLQKQFPDFPDFADWKKDADLLILPPEQFKNVRIPFKITVSVPDLDLLQQRLNNGPE